MDMTDTNPETTAEETPQQRISRIATDGRARVPLALIGVLLLLTSVMVVGHVETQQPATPDVDASIAIDQTEAATQTAVRDGAQRATEQAATQPLTAAADNEWGAVLAASEESDGDRWRIHPRFADGEVTEDTFTTYLKALIYLEVQSGLAQSGQTVGEINTSVSLPAIEDPASFEAAVDRVTLTEPEEGMLEVTIANLTLLASHRGERIERREMTVEVSIATPIMQLHERVRTFQSALDAGIMERGFSQRFNARIYAIGWARGYMQNYRLPIVEVLANRHIEPAANSALYRTQQDVFGAADPTLDDAVRLGWTCMAIKDGGAMFDEYMASNGMSYRNVSADGNSLVFERDDGTTAELELPDGAATAEALCSSAEYLLGEQATGQQPAPPNVTDLLGTAPGMNAEETIAVEEAAYLPMARMVDPDYRDSFVAAIQRIFTIEGAVESTSTVLDPLELAGRARCTEPRNRNGTYRTQVESSIRQTALDQAQDGGELYYEAESEIEATVRKKLDCTDETDPVIDTDTFGVRISSTVSEATANPFATIDEVNDVGIDPHKYERGAGSARLPPTFRNYDGADREVTETIFGAEIGTGAHAHWIDSALTGSITDEAELDRAVSNALNTRELVELDHDEFLDAKLAAVMAADIREIQRDVEDISHQFARPALLDRGEDSPFRQLIAAVEEEISREYLDRNTAYDSVGQKAIYESRHAYLRTLVDELERLEAGHDEAISTIDDELSALDSGVDNAVTFLQQGVSADQPEPIPLESSTLTEEMTYELSGAPTYLVAENLTKADVPAIEADTEFAPLAMKNREYVDLPYDEVISSIVERIAGFVGLGEPDAEIGFQMAGDVLLAGDLALAANDTEERFDEPGTAAVLERDLETFEDNVDDALDSFYADVGKETAIELYPSPVAECVVLDPPVAGTVDPRRPTPSGPAAVDPCIEIRDEAEEGLVETITAAEDAISDAARTGVAGYGSVALKAVSIGRGNATEPIIDNVTAAVDSDRYRYDGFDEHYEERQWKSVIDSAVRPAVERASAMTVEIGESDDAEEIDETLQTALENVTEEMVEDRLQRVGDDVEDAISERTSQWAGEWSGARKRPARVPAGLPLLPIPGSWYATLNVWDVEVAGEYARFEASANMGTPEQATATTYVRERRTVVHEIAGERRALGTVQPIEFSGRSHLVVITPPGVGVGDRDDENPECSPTFPVVGEVDPDGIQCQENGYAHDVAWTTERQSTDEESEGN